MVQVIPIVTSQVDWNALLVLTSKALGRSLTKSVDSQRWQLPQARSGIVALAEFQQSSQNATTVLRDPGSVLRHMMVSFLVYAPREMIFEIAVDGDVQILDCERDDLAIVSATLEDWRTTIVRFCSERSTLKQREFYYKALEAFDSLGLSGLFENYSRKSSTMVLTEK